MNPIAQLSAGKFELFDSKSKLVNIVIEAPKGSRCKYKYDETARIFRVNKLLPLGASFPYNYGYVPATRGQDGDPLDVLVLSDEPFAVGCVVPVRLIGVIEAQQTERSGKTVQNDRLLSVLETQYNPPQFHSIDDVDEQTLAEIEHFFIAFNQIEGRTVHPTGRGGPDRARQLIEQNLRTE
jgi:inorganic pyrophosphatase